MAMSRDQNAVRIRSVRNDNSTFERVEEFKYLGIMLFLSFRRVLNVICSFLGNSPASEF